MNLCFSPEFFGEFIAGLGYTGRPTTVVQALHEMSFTNWYKMERSIHPEFERAVTIHDVLALIRKTNTCTDINTNPVEVWIDEQGDFKIEVYDARKNS